MHYQMVMSNPDKGDPRTYDIIGAAMEVDRHLGTGYLEAVTKDALSIEMTIRKMPFMTEVPFRVSYKGHQLPGYYRADFVCFESIIVEVKASTRSPELEQAQMLNYLRCSGLTHGLLLNFAGPKLTFKRFIKSDLWVPAATEERT